MALTGDQFQQLQQALLSAFPTHAALAQMLRTGLDQNLDEIAMGGLRDVVFKLISEMEAQGKLEQLVVKAQEANPGNPDLAAFHLANPDTIPHALSSSLALDLSHGQQQWGTFKHFAEGPEFQFTLIRQDFLQQKQSIESARSVVMALPFHCLFTEQEADYLEAWVFRGGGLFLMGNYAADIHHTANPSYLARRFGFHFNNDLVTPEDKATERDARLQVWSQEADRAVKVCPDSQAHPLVSQIDEIALLSCCSLAMPHSGLSKMEYVLMSPPTSTVMEPQGNYDTNGFMPAIDEWIVTQQASVPLLAAIRFGQGRVVACGSWKLCTLAHADNVQFVRNILLWLGSS